MKYVLIQTSADKEYARHFPSVGFCQWAKVFSADIVEATDIIKSGSLPPADAYHIRLCRENIDLLNRLRLNPSQAAVIVHVDTPIHEWQQAIGSNSQIEHVLSPTFIVLGVEYMICQRIKKITGRKCYEMAHPADLEQIRSYQRSQQQDIYTIIDNSNRKCGGFRLFYYFAKLAGAKRQIALEASAAKAGKIEKDICLYHNEAELCTILQESRFVLSSSPYHSYGSTVIYAAALKTPMLAFNTTDAARRCYLFTTAAGADKDFFSMYWWLKNEDETRSYIAQNASDKVEFYNHGNIRKRMLDLLCDITGNKQWGYWEYKAKQQHQDAGVVFMDNIHHISGKKQIEYSAKEFAVVCLEKNGSEYLQSLLAHYRQLGAAHFIFIDNGSTDDTIERLRHEPDVTLYSTALPHKKYENEIRRVVIQEHCRGKWCLCVDIDELYDFPANGKIQMSDMLGTLNLKKQTAVMAYMLDMFSHNIAFTDEIGDEDLTRNYPLYDISSIQKKDYFSHNQALCNYNRFAGIVHPLYFGGIRKDSFKNHGNKYLLSKHPLFFLDGDLEPITDPHYCNKAFIADFTCVLRHYKFTASIKNKVRQSLEEGAYTYFAEKEYQAYHDVLNNKDSMEMNSSNAQAYTSADDLVSNGFLSASKRFCEEWGLQYKGPTLKERIKSFLFKPKRTDVLKDIYI